MKKVAQGFPGGQYEAFGFHKTQYDAETAHGGADPQMHDVFEEFEGQEVEVFVRPVNRPKLSGEAADEYELYEKQALKSGVVPNEEDYVKMAIFDYARNRMRTRKKNRMAKAMRGKDE